MVSDSQYPVKLLAGVVRQWVVYNMDSVREYNGEWQKGITYDGYYIIAADPPTPMGTIVTVYNHGYSGDGLQAGVPV